MTDRREFLKLISILSAWPRGWLQATAGAAHPGAENRAHRSETGGGVFPVTIQPSPLPGQPAWNELAARGDARALLRSAIDQCVRHGFTGLEYPFHLAPELEQYALEYARSRRLFLAHNYTFAKGGWGGDLRPRKPPAISVFADGYLDAVKEKLAPVLAQAERLSGLYNLFCYQDEPFHAVPESFDHSEPAKEQFRKRFGYEMPEDLVTRTATSSLTSRFRGSGRNCCGSPPAQGINWPDDRFQRTGL